MPEADIDKLIEAISSELMPRANAVVATNSKNIYMRDNDLGGLASSFTDVENINLEGNKNVGNLAGVTGAGFSQNQFSSTFDRGFLVEVLEELKKLRESMATHPVSSAPLSVKNEILRVFFVKVAAEFFMTVLTKLSCS
jgi:hypothetical protein